jgi:hypothetical protein
MVSSWKPGTGISTGQRLGQSRRSSWWCAGWQAESIMEKGQCFYFVFDDD